jgi:ATP-dependent phosphofructokinase / diphosphate-dependent phosphofructokinase
MTRNIGVLTSGGDTPGLNAAIRALGKAAYHQHDMRLIGFRDGFRGLMENHTIRLGPAQLSGILTVGGTILGTSRDKPHQMPVGGRLVDMTDVMLATYKKHNLDCLVCLGGGGTQKNAYVLAQKGMNIVTLPKTIDNDVAETDITFGYYTALGIATEAIDRLHSTAHSHHRIIVVEIMGHKAGWLALGAGTAGGADVILIPEIPYDVETVARAIRIRRKQGKHFSIVAVAEGAVSRQEAAELAKLKRKITHAKNNKKKAQHQLELIALENRLKNSTMNLSMQLEQLTGLESRVTILGHVQRGGRPSSADRLLATRLGTAATQLIHQRQYGVMVAVRGEGTAAVPLADVAGKSKLVPLDHPQLLTARQIGTNFGDEEHE